MKGVVMMLVIHVKVEVDIERGGDIADGEEWI